MNTILNENGKSPRRLRIKLAMSAIGVAATVAAIGVLGSGVASAATQPKIKSHHSALSRDPVSKDRVESARSVDRRTLDRINPDRATGVSSSGLSIDSRSVDR